MKPFKRVLIVGGGIGGLTLAVALGRQGLKAEVIELKPKTRSRASALSSRATRSARFAPSA